MTFGELRELHERVQARFREALNLHGARYEALGVRYDGVVYRKLRVEMAALGADLRALQDATDERLIYLAHRGATQAGAPDPWGAQAYSAMQTQFATMRPKMTPVELLLRFRDSGIVVVVDPEGNLRVSPANALTEADRAVLLDYKPEIVKALAAAEVVI